MVLVEIKDFADRSEQEDLKNREKYSKRLGDQLSLKTHDTLAGVPRLATRGADGAVWTLAAARLIEPSGRRSVLLVPRGRRALAGRTTSESRPQTPSCAG